MSAYHYDPMDNELMPCGHTVDSLVTRDNEVKFCSECWREGVQVIYVPGHANGDIHHKDCQKGFITGVCRDGRSVFVRYFYGNTDELRTRANSESTMMSDLQFVWHKPQGMINLLLVQIETERMANS